MFHWKMPRPSFSKNTLACARAAARSIFTSSFRTRRSTRWLHLAGTIPVLLGTSSDRWIEFFGIKYALPDLWRPFMDGGVPAVVSVLGQQVIKFPAAMLVMAGLVFWQLLMYVAALAGVLAHRRVDAMALRWNIVVVGISILVLVLTPGQGGHERFRVPVQPLLAILAAYGVAWGGGWWSKLRSALLSGSRASELTNAQVQAPSV